jgi:[acyl-carrier-protein] S-malonyltransferase
MKLGLLFAGQGSQRPAMGKDFYEQYPAFRDIFDYLTEDEKRAAFDGPAEKLSDTRYTQPVMVAFAAGVTALLKEQGIKPDMTLGLSLGEYSALSAAEVFTPEETVNIVRKRAEAMSKASEGIDCAMMAVLGGERNLVEECCIEASNLTGKKVQAVNFNCPGQIVISGLTEAVEQASKLLMEKGIKRCLKLPVSGPFHTDFMKPAGAVLRNVFDRMENLEERPMRFPVVFNATGNMKKDEETIADLLVRQVSSPVLLEDSIRLMKKEGIDIALEIGPGKTLSGFVKKTASDIETLSIESACDFEDVMRQLTGAK